MNAAPSRSGEWRVVPFSEVAESVTERVEDPSTSGVDVYVGLDHLDPNTLKISRWGSPADVESTKLRFYPGDVIYARRRAYQRKLGVAEVEGICSAHALVLRAKPTVCLPTFLPYFLQSDQFHDRALDISVGSLSPTINWKTLEVQEFALPPLDEQERIVEVMQAIDGYSAGLGASLRQLYALERALESEAWSELEAGQQLGEMADITVGIVVRPADLYVKVGGVSALRSLNVAPNRLVTADMVHISDNGHANHQKSALVGGEVVVVRSGRPGDAAVIPHDGVPRNAIDLLIVRCHSELNPQYLSRYLNSSVARRQMLGRSAGTAQQHLNAGQLKQIVVPSVPLESQEAVLETFRAIETTSEEAKKTLEGSQSVASELREHLLKGVASVH